MSHIGEPHKVIQVEPISEPVPSRDEPVPAPREAPTPQLEEQPA